MPGSAWSFRRRSAEIAWRCGIGAWVVAAASVWIWGANYGFETYSPSPAYSHKQWPIESTLQLAKSRPTLVLFLHPQCPCSRASVRELQRLLDSSRFTSEQRPEVIVLASHPSNGAADWRRTDTIEQASRLPRATVVFDSNGDETARFGAVVSGTVMLFAPSGERLFAGGVTAARGHEGENVGSEALEVLLTQGRALPVMSTPVFGCKLCAPDDAAE